MSKKNNISDEHSIEFLAKRWDNSRKAKESALGSKEDYPRLSIECDIAGLNYKLALERNSKELLMERIAQQAETIIDLVNKVDQWQSFLRDIPQRLTILEGAYAHVSMMAHGNSYTNKLLEAYEIGKRAKTDQDVSDTNKSST